MFNTVKFIKHAVRHTMLAKKPEHIRRVPFLIQALAKIKPQLCNNRYLEFKTVNPATANIIDKLITLPKALSAV